MTQYLVIKKVNLQVGKAVFRKDAIITAEQVTQRNIERYLKRGYIKPIGEGEPDATEPTSEGGEGTPTKFPTPPEYLTEEEVIALERTDLLTYAKIVGVKGFRSNIPTVQLAALVNKFIDEVLADEDDEDNVGEGNGEPDPAKEGGEGGEGTPQE